MMKLGDLLVAAKLVTADQVTAALNLQRVNGKNLGENLVAVGAISQGEIDDFLHRMPRAPQNLDETGLDLQFLLNLLLKQIYVGRLELASQIAAAIKLPPLIVQQLIDYAIKRQLLRALGSRKQDSYSSNYGLTDEGMRWAKEALQQSQYTGPAPVTLEAFVHQASLQKITNVMVTLDKIRRAFSELTIPDDFIEKIGPALNSDRAILLYGPPGNGKTSIALSFANIFNDLIFIPHAVFIGEQIMRVFDSSLHVQQRPGENAEFNDLLSLPHEELDHRWVPCQRPFVVTGGELTLEMLDLRYDPVTNFYEAPLHVKALGGCFVVDDFGRQLATPISILNRWIVPLEHRIDYLKLHTGKSFPLPFEELVIFSTNLNPKDLVENAYMRRLPYKLFVGAPSIETFRTIFERAAHAAGMELTEAIFDHVVEKITVEKGLTLAGYQPGFIVDQVVSTCRFMGATPHMEDRFVDYAIDNLGVLEI